MITLIAVYRMIHTNQHAGTEGRPVCKVRLLQAAAWAALDDHFQYHVRLAECFRDAGREAVTFMWTSLTNECGKQLSQFARDALRERHCELFGTRPERPSYHADATELERTNLCIAKGKQGVADQRRRVAERECVHGDTAIRGSRKPLLVTLEVSLHLMIGYGRVIEQMARARHIGDGH